jgi:hypothetical protein
VALLREMGGLAERDSVLEVGGFAQRDGRFSRERYYTVL